MGGEIRGSINVVVRTVIVCKLQGFEVHAVVRQRSGDSKKSKTLEGEASSQGNTQCDRL